MRQLLRLRYLQWSHGSTVHRRPHDNGKFLSRPHPRFASARTTRKRFVLKLIAIDFAVAFQTTGACAPTCGPPDDLMSCDEQAAQMPPGMVCQQITPSFAPPMCMLSASFAPKSCVFSWAGLLRNAHPAMRRLQRVQHLLNNDTVHWRNHYGRHDDRRGLHRHNSGLPCNVRSTRRPYFLRRASCCNAGRDGACCNESLTMANQGLWPATAQCVTVLMYLQASCEMLTQQCGDCTGCSICNEESTLPYTGEPTTTVRHVPVHGCFVEQGRRRFAS